MVHLKTTYTIQSDSVKKRMGQFMMALHPTPALCGLPKNEAFRLIKEEEGFSRQLYGGFLGPVSGNDFQFFVNIRCMKMSREETFLYLGGGLTRESVEEKEWEETRLKARTLLRALHAVQKSIGNESPNLR
jgi:isochorismate synthase